MHNRYCYFLLINAGPRRYAVLLTPNLGALQIRNINDDLLHCLAAKRIILQYQMAYIFIALYTPLF